MIINPILPVWLMGSLCVIYLLLNRRGAKNYIRQILILILLFIINLRIMVGSSEAETALVGADVLFVVDNTISMLAEDYDGAGRRLDAVKEDCKYIMEQLPGSSYSLVSFGNNVQSMVPYTIDVTVVDQAIRSLEGQAKMYAVGTSLNDVLKELPNLLDNDRDNVQVVFFISDGEITNGESLKSATDLKKYVDYGAVLGYGTQEGGPMRAISFFGSEDEKEYLTYYDVDLGDQKSISKIDEANLKTIAGDMGVEYIHMTEPSQMDESLTKIRRGIETAPKEKKADSTEGYSDIYHWFVIPLLLLLVIDFIYYKRRGTV